MSTSRGAFFLTIADEHEFDHEETLAPGSTGASVITERWLSTADHQAIR
jgi:hypothetical protein